MSADTPSAAFLAFWDAYRCKRRVKRLEAWTEWKRQGCEAIAAEVMEGLARFKLTDSWPAFAPEAPRWLKHQRWTDDPVEDEPDPGSGEGWDVTGAPKHNDRGE